MKEKIYFLVPYFLQNILISIFNICAYGKRYGGKYQYYLTHFKRNRTLTREELIQIQKVKYAQFLEESAKKSIFYKDILADIDGYNKIENIRELPIIKKEILRAHSKEIHTITEKEGILSKTGGTTGKSLEVVFSLENMQERYAMLDDFRSRFGYQLGKKTAWFSGKNLLSNQDIKKNRFWRTDYYYNVRYYSTFHIKQSYLKYYIEDLINYKVEYIVGFPSSILDIAKYGVKHNINFPKGLVKAIFPTAETITEEMRICIEKFFKSPMYDQYASSEGAPFIFECEQGNLHLELQSGVFEVLDDQDKSAKSGRLITTSFTTVGTPLIRYDIGDSITLSDGVCTCPNKNPLVKEIIGRIDDYIYSPENGKINLGNVSNTLKDTKGIKKFQAKQDELNKICLIIEIDTNVYNKKIEQIFINNWKRRVGNEMTIDIHYVDEIKTESSGKFRIVKNNIKHLLENG